MQHGPCDGLQLAVEVSVHGRSSGSGCRDIGKQHASLQSSSQPQSHSSPGSTTPLPQMERCGSDLGNNLVLFQIYNRLQIALTCKTPLNTACLCIQYRFDGAQRARRELIVIPFVTRRGSREHNVIAVFAAGRTLFGIVLCAGQTYVN